MPHKASPSGRRVRRDFGNKWAHPDQWAELGPGLRVSRQQTFELVDEDLDATATVVLVFDESLGRFDAQELAIRRGPSAPPMKEVLRGFRLATLIDRFAMDVVSEWTLVEAEPGTWRPAGSGRLEDETEERFVARIYRMATAVSHRPNKAVAEALQVAPSTAAQKVWLARKLGLLPPTRPGKARA